MRIIRIITDQDVVQGGNAEILVTVSRYGARGVLVDAEGNVAMMYLSERNLYKLPGGGVEDGEQAGDAFLREIEEETGYEADIVHELGTIAEHKKQKDFLQLSYCFVAKARGERREPMLTDNEKKLGMSVRWMTSPEALEVMRESLLRCQEYSAKFMIMRDLAILEEAASQIISKFD